MIDLRQHEFRPLALNARHVKAAFLRTQATEEERNQEDLVYRIRPLAKELTEKDSEEIVFSREMVARFRPTIGYLLGQLGLAHSEKKGTVVQGLFFNYKEEQWANDWSSVLMLLALGQAAWLLSPVIRTGDKLVCFRSSYCIPTIDPRDEEFGQWWPQTESTFLRLKEKTEDQLKDLLPYTIEFGRELSGKRQYEAAFYLYELAAQQGIADGFIWMACAYRDGHGKERDLVKTFELYKRAADLGDPSAAYCCGEACRKGRGTVQDLDKAFSYYRYGADLGHKWSKDLCEICEMIFRETGDPQAQYEIGQKYEALEVRDTEAAMEWYCKAAEGGHKEACMISGFYYGGTVQLLYQKPAADLQRSAACFQKAADQGDILAKKIISLMVRNGQVRDLKEVLLELSDAKKFGRMDLSLRKRLNDMWMYLPGAVRSELMNGILNDL